MADVQFKDFADGTPAGDNILLQQDTTTGVYSKFLSSLIHTTLQQAFNNSANASDNPTISASSADDGSFFSIVIVDTAQARTTSLVVTADGVSMQSIDTTLQTGCTAYFNADSAGIELDDFNAGLACSIALGSNSELTLNSDTAQYTIKNLIDAVDDAAAAAAGVQVDSMYRNGSHVMIRIT